MAKDRQWAHKAERKLVGVVGGDTLLGREIRDLLNATEAKPRVQLLAAGATADESGKPASEEDDDALVTAPLNAENLKGSAAAFLAATPAASRRAVKLNPKGGPVLIDLTGALEDQPQARLRAPSAEPASAGPNAGAPAPIQVIAHPAAIAAAEFLSKLVQVAPFRRSLIHIFEPASERGQKGIAELQQQNRALLSFQKIKADVFDAQLAFNMLARYGEEALESLELIEQRAERHLASLLTRWPAIPMPSLRMIQAPVFHGHSLSVWAEFDAALEPKALEPKELEAGLAKLGMDVREDDPPTNAGIAGQDGVSVGAIARDRNHSRACWFWLASDNVRLAAQNAVAVALELL